MTELPVSIIIPVKNGERFLASALDSVVAQTFTRYEIIVVDGHSTDRTAEIARSYGAVRYICQTGLGLSHAYNTGIETARGEFVAFLAADDMWTPDKLSVQVDYLMNNPDIQYTIARVKFFLEAGFPLPPGFRKELLENDYVGRILETLVARKTLFDVIGKFDPNVAISMDVDWFVRANDRDISMAILPRVLLHRRVHDTNTSLQVEINNKRYNEEMLGVLRRSVRRKQIDKKVSFKNTMAE
jgi:glycosyltransferase involved in cell wall biosynthesis